ncbi:MAG TPA: adenylate/guanylate cyclase domain-containing protein [Pseudomonadota bacterium]|nr:adenylate/guanylate cyclase domain-containing protein [Pseudomonadota bacterium]
MTSSGSPSMIDEYEKRIAELERRCQDLETIIETTSEHADFIEAELEKRNQFIRNLFGRYVTEEVVEQILSTPDGQTLIGERRVITVLSSDLRGFTALAERLPAEDIIRILNCYLGIMSDVIASRGGTIGAFLGDGIIVYFGAPIRMEDHARKAILCALSMQAAMTQVNEQMREHGYPALEMGIGINTGDVVVGNVGSEKRAQYGAVGGSVNLAFRIESYSVGGDVLASEATLNAAGPGVSLLGSAQAFPKGSPGPITIYSISGLEEHRELSRPAAVATGVELKVPRAIAIWPVHEKTVAPHPSPGLMLRLSSSSASLKFADGAAPPSVYANLRLEIADVGEAYAKVTGHESVDGRFVIRFTQHSPTVESWIAEVVHDERS